MHSGTGLRQRRQHGFVRAPEQYWAVPVLFLLCMGQATLCRHYQYPPKQCALKNATLPSSILPQARARYDLQPSRALMRTPTLPRHPTRPSWPPSCPPYPTHPYPTPAACASRPAAVRCGAAPPPGVIRRAGLQLGVRAGGHQRAGDDAPGGHPRVVEGVYCWWWLLWHRSRGQYAGASLLGDSPAKALLLSSCALPKIRTA